MPTPAPLPTPSRRLRVAICSDIHYASAGEERRGEEYEFRAITNPLARWAFRAYRHGFWMRHPLRNNPLVDAFLRQTEGCDYAVANGDYAADTAFLGVSDDATFESVRLCLEKLRGRFGWKLLAGLGDHELGKRSFFGHYGGMRLASWQRAHAELGLRGFWRQDFGRYVFLGVTSSLLALPAFGPDLLPEEREEWHRLRNEHLAQVRDAFAGLDASRRVVLFCHDPTALPFLARESAVRARLAQIELTVIGHLHANLILRKSRLLAGMPRISFLGSSIQRMSGALREAREWRSFRVRLCPALAGIQVQRGGGWCSLELDVAGEAPLTFRTHPLRRGAGV